MLATALCAICPAAAAAEQCTEGVDVMAPGSVHVEGGWTFYRDREDREQSLGQVLVRAGVGPLELRAGLNSYTWARGAAGFGDGCVGIKLRGPAAGERSWLPASAFVLTVTVPSGASAFRSSRPLPEGRACLSWRLGPATSLASNLSVAAVSDEQPESAVTASLGRTWSPHVATFLEYATHDGVGAARARDHRLAAGLSLSVRSGTQLEIRAGAMPEGGGLTSFGGVILHRDLPGN